MNFLKQYWFGLLVTLVLLLAALLFLIVLLSPRQDNQRRGFIPCTENMAAELYDCNGRSFCMLGAVLNNSLCDAGVVWTGVKEWSAGKQAAPWSNYFFTPDVSSEDEIAPEVEEFYRENPNLRQDVLQLENMHEQLLENQEDETEIPQSPIIENQNKDESEDVRE